MNNQGRIILGCLLACLAGGGVWFALSRPAKPQESTQANSSELPQNPTSRADRFAGVKPESILSARDPGEYSPIKTDDLDKLVLEVPFHSHGPLHGETLETFAYDTAIAICRALKADKFDDPRLASIKNRNSSDNFNKVLSYYSGESPNFCWEAINTSASGFDAYPLDSAELKDLPEGPSLAANIAGIDQSKFYYVRLDCRIQHHLGGYNKLCFGFAVDPSAGEAQLVSTLHTNLLTVPDSH